MEKYDSIGKEYLHTRFPDPRITEKIIKNLNLDTSSVIADIGAGTGNYTFELAKQGFKMIAIEPSKVMQSQAKHHPRIEWIYGTAEKIPLEDFSVDGVICVLATHHFTDFKKGISEMLRIAKQNAPIIIFTADPRLLPENFWMNQYFSFVFKEGYKIHPPMAEFRDTLQEISKDNVEMISFKLPYDIRDGFLCSAWKKPEKYLNPTFRASISSFANTKQQSKLEIAIKSLKQDIDNNSWKKKYGEILDQEEYECGYFFLITKKQIT